MTPYGPAWQMLISGPIGGTDCESLREGLLAQPSNAATSAAYVVAALYVWWRHRHGAAVVYAVLLALIGIGSIFYHGPQPTGSRLAHDVPIAAVVILSAGLVLVRYNRGDPMLPGLTRGRVAWLAACSLLGLTAYALGRTGAVLCHPDSLAQAHGLWHICSAAVFAILADVLFVTPDRGAPDPLPHAPAPRSD